MRTAVVAECWVLDPGRQVAALDRLATSEGGETGFLPPLHLSAELDDLLTTPLLPGFSIALREIFQR